MHSLSIVSTILALGSTAWAYTTPTTFNVTSNPVFTPNSGDVVPVGKPYKITWGPSESGTVTILLLRGPAEDIKPLYSIAENIANSGSFSWTPKSDLENDKTHYGLQIIKDSNGQFQYSTQFGISNPGYQGGSSSSSSSLTSSATKYEPTTTSTAVYTSTKHSSVTSMITVTTSTPVYHNTTTTSSKPTHAPPAHNGTMTHSVSTSGPTYSATAPPVPSPTGNSAAGLQVASGLLMGVAAVAAMLL